MKTTFASSIFPRPQRGGYTLVEVLITLVTAVLVVGAVMAAHIYGLKMLQFTKPKLSASDEARKALALITTDVRSARAIRLGNMAGGSYSNFTRLAPFSLQVGSAIQVFPTTNYSRYIIYFWDATTQKLMRTADGATATSVVANSISNQMIFRAEDFAGNTLSNDFNNRVIAMKLEFYQIQYPITAIGPGNYYDSYQLNAKLTRRTLQ